MSQPSIHASLVDQKSTPDVTRDSYRDAMSRLGAAVSIITTDGPAGRAGFTASAVCSVTDTPPTLLVCLNKSSSVISTFEQNEALCVNVCSPAHQKLAMLFGGKTANGQRFAGANWRKLLSGAPVLDHAGVAFDCLMEDSVEVGTHRVFFCRVQAISMEPDAKCLINHGRNFYEVPA